jgi:hypothetical protein
VPTRPDDPDRALPSPARRGPAAGGAEILRWPADAARREELRLEGRPRLLVLDAGAQPPSPTDDREDWTWTPVDERDLFSRLQRLASLAAPDDVDLDDLVVRDGSACLAGLAVALPPLESRLLEVLLEPPRRVRSRDEVHQALWGDEPRVHRALDSRIFTLRRRLAPLGVTVVAVRRRGLTLARSHDGPAR